MFQPLTPGLGDSTQPIVLPVINRDWQFEPDSVGGTLKLNANLLDIVREVGTQTRRLSLEQRVGTGPSATGSAGEYKFQASLRGDGYSVNWAQQLVQPRSAERLFLAERHAAAATCAL